MAETLQPSPTQRAALVRRLTWAPRNVARVFSGFGLAIGGVVFVVAQLSQGRDLPISTVMSVFLVPPVAFGAFLYGRGWLRVRRLLAGPLARGEGTITEISDASDGGPTRVRFSLALPGGGEATGALNTYHLEGAVGDAVALWFAADGSSFFPADLEVNCDPGEIAR